MLLFRTGALSDLLTKCGRGNRALSYLSLLLAGSAVTMRMSPPCLCTLLSLYVYCALEIDFPGDLAFQPGRLDLSRIFVCISANFVT